MIKETNKRIMITLPKKQVEWLYEYAKSKNLTPSNLIKYLLVKRINDLYDLVEAQKNPEKLKEMIDLAKTKWAEN